MIGIDNWLVLLSNALDEAIRTSLRSRRDWVTLASPVAGEAANEGEAMIVLTLLGVRPAPAANVPPRAPARAAGGGGAAAAAPLLLDADLLVSVRPGGGRYAEALMLLSRAMLWLHANPSLGAEHDPHFGALGHRLTIEFAPLEPDRLASLAAPFGTVGRPCALYRLRGMAIWEEEHLAPVIEAL